MVLGKLPVPARPTYLNYIRARAYCACQLRVELFGPFLEGAGEVVWTFFLSSAISDFFLPLSRKRPGIY